MSLYENIHKKRKRIAAGSGEKMRKKGAKGAPTEANFTRAAKTAKNAMYGGTMKRNMKDGGKAGLKALVRAGQSNVVEDMGFDPQNLKKGSNVCSNRQKMMMGDAVKGYTTENKRYGGGVPNPRKPDDTMV